MPRREQHLKLGHVQSDVCVGKVLPIRLLEELFENVIYCSGSPKEDLQAHLVL